MSGAESEPDTAGPIARTEKAVIVWGQMNDCVSLELIASMLESFIVRTSLLFGLVECI